MPMELRKKHDEVVKRRLFGSSDLIKEFTASLTLVETSADGWTTKYYNDLSKEYWLKYVVDDRSFETNLMLLSPRPTTSELISISLTSPYLDEVLAAATRLYIDEQEEKIEFRGNLIDKLNSLDLVNMSSNEKERIKTVIQSSNLLHGVNIRNIVGKHHTEIESDAQFFRSVSEMARLIFEKL
jgi:hypothetical protein